MLDVLFGLSFLLLFQIFTFICMLVCFASLFDLQSFVDELEDQSAKTEKLLSTNKNLQDMNKALLIQVCARRSMARERKQLVLPFLL